MLVAGAAWSTRDLETRERSLLPSGTTGVVVIDLSLSITDNDYDTLRGVFRRLIEEDASIGLVVFSDVSYELLPPGTPASQLRPVLRLSSAAARAARESVDADIPRGHADLVGAPAGEDDARARRSTPWIGPARERPRDRTR